MNGFPIRKPTVHIAASSDHIGVGIRDHTSLGFVCEGLAMDETDPRAILIQLRNARKELDALEAGDTTYWVRSSLGSQYDDAVSRVETALSLLNSKDQDVANAAREVLKMHHGKPKLAIDGILALVEAESPTIRRVALFEIADYGVLHNCGNRLARLLVRYVLNDQEVDEVRVAAYIAIQRLLSNDISWWLAIPGVETHSWPLDWSVVHSHVDWSLLRDLHSSTMNHSSDDSTGTL